MSSLSKLKNKMEKLIILDEATVQILMIQMRKVLEEKNLKETLSHLNFYCNWSVHDSLSGVKTCRDILIPLTKAINLTKEEINQEWYNDHIVNIFDAKKLRFEILNLFEKFNIPKKEIFENYEDWSSFFTYLRKTLSAHKIELTAPFSKQEKKVHDEMVGIANNNLDMVIKSIRLIDQTDVQKSFLWEIQTHKEYVSIQGPFVMNEHRF